MSVNLTVCLVRQETQFGENDESELIRLLLLLQRVASVREVIDEECIVPRVLVCEEEELLAQITVGIRLHQVFRQVLSHQVGQLLHDEKGERFETLLARTCPQELLKQ